MISLELTYVRMPQHLWPCDYRTMVCPDLFGRRGNKMKIGFNSSVCFVLISALWWPVAGSACGGFFCQTLPIDQAGEQIVFRKDSSQITAMVQIQFEGEASDFGWVVPVPSTPEIDIGNNAVFTALDLATRPQFNLTRSGQACEVSVLATSSGGDASVDENDSVADSGVIVESVEEVGSYIATVISGTDPQAVANWLLERNYQLTADGAGLLAPYVEDGMKFVALKLQDNRDEGSIQPLILKYQSEKPVIPIRLTAVAALEDMGVLVWVVGDARAVPENYLHVTPNYTRLNWYTGSSNAYASYQSLITDAMNEAGGQGFATDYAGRFNNLGSRLPSAEGLRNSLNQLGSLGNADFITGTLSAFGSDPSVLSALAAVLPLPDGQTASLYFDQTALSVSYTGEELAAARAALDTFIRDDVIEPTRVSVDLLDDNRYLTRLYTTLSADEMTVDPAFVFNSDMGEQQLDRNANLDASCVNDQTKWTLTLGEGTGRNDVMVIDAVGPVPLAAPAMDQAASWKVERTSNSGLPVVADENSYAPVSVAPVSTGGGGMGVGLFLFVVAGAYRRNCS